MKPIPYGKQKITDDDISEIISVLKSDYLTQGPKVQEFENSFSEYIGAKYSVAVSNGTAALHLSILSLDLKPGDKVITSPISFVASSNCVLYEGGTIDFVDIDPQTAIIDLELLEKKLKNSKPGTYKGVIPVDFAGYPVNTEKLRKIANEYGLWILEDACHAPGGYFIDSKNQNIHSGDGKYSDVSIFSFHPVKHIATGEGGMVTTNSKSIYQKLLLFRTHGITKNSELYQNSEELLEKGPWYYEMLALGYNYRMPDILAALGVSQLKRAKQNIKRRREIALQYSNAFQNQKDFKPLNPYLHSHAYHLYIILHKFRKKIYQKLQEKQIFSQVHYIPIHLQPYYLKLGFKKGDFPNAEEYYSKALSIPMYPSLSDDEVKYIIDSLIG